MGAASTRATNAEALAAGAAGQNLEVARSDGFLSAYGATSVENDLNVYAETIFTDAERVVRLAKSQPRVARKAGLLMGAYTNLDPRFKALFAGFGLGSLQAPTFDSLNEGSAVSPIAIPSGRIVHSTVE